MSIVDIFEEVSIKSDLKKIKSDIRKHILDKRNHATIDDKREAARSIIADFIGNVPIEKSDIISAYWPISSEVDIKFLLDVLVEEGHRVALPRIVKKDNPLIFKEYHIGMDLVFNKVYKVSEPPESTSTLIPTIMIVPLVACDIKGNRLGYGGGFYDRTIKNLKKTGNLFTVGVGYDSQVVAELPREKHDQYLDCIITEKRVIVCANS